MLRLKKNYNEKICFSNFPWFYYFSETSKNLQPKNNTSFFKSFILNIGTTNYNLAWLVVAPRLCSILGQRIIGQFILSHKLHTFPTFQKWKKIKMKNIVIQIPINFCNFHLKILLVPPFVESSIPYQRFPPPPIFLQIKRPNWSIFIAGLKTSNKICSVFIGMLTKCKKPPSILENKTPAPDGHTDFNPTSSGFLR